MSIYPESLNALVSIIFLCNSIKGVFSKKNMNFGSELSFHTTFSMFRTGSNQSYVMTFVLTSCVGHLKELLLYHAS